MRVLVVDDDVEFVDDLIAVKLPDVSIDIAHDTREAFESLRAHVPDAIVLDLSMAPTLALESSSEGLAVLGAIMGGHRGRIPIVVVTESTDPDARGWCTRLGAATVLDKASGLTPIFCAIRHVVESRGCEGG